MQRDVERVEELYAALNRRKAKDALILVSKEIKIGQSPELPWGGEYLGHEGMRQYLGQMAEHLESRMEIECLVDAGQQVVAVGRLSGKSRVRQIEFEIPLVHVWTVQEGEITRLDAYMDNATMLAALGL